MNARFAAATTLLALVLLGGCASIGMFGGRSFSVGYSGDQSAIQRALLQHLRANALVSEAANELIVDTEPYVGESKGLFGLGPKWQEKIVYVVRVLGPRRVTRQSVSGPIQELVMEPRYVEVEAEVLERQSANFDWRKKGAEPVRQSAVRDFFRDIQDFVSKFPP